MDTYRDNGLIQGCASRPTDWEYNNTWSEVGTVLGYNPIDTRYADTPVTSRRKRTEERHLHIRDATRAELGTKDAGQVVAIMIRVGRTDPELLNTFTAIVFALLATPLCDQHQDQAGTEQRRFRTRSSHSRAQHNAFLNCGIVSLVSERDAQSMKGC